MPNAELKVFPHAQYTPVLSLEGTDVSQSPVVGGNWAVVNGVLVGHFGAWSICVFSSSL